MIHSFMAIFRLLFLLAFIASWFLLFILLFRVASSSTDARPLPPDATDLDDAQAGVPERCSNNAQNRHSYYWTVQHPNQTDITHHLYGFLALKGQVQWDNLSVVQRAHFEAANVSVFESDATGLAELQECVRNASERETPLSATLAERLDAYFDPSTDHRLLPLVGREWRELSAGWLLVGLLQVQVNQGIASLAAERPASKGEAWHGSLLQQAERMQKRVEFVERMPKRCDALPSVNQSKLAIGIEHLMDELEALEYASADARAAPVKRIIELYKCGQYGPADAMIGMQFLSSVSAERKDNLTRLNKLLLHDLMSGRNRRWMERILPMLQNNTQGLSYFFAMNSLHFLVAKDSLVDLLRSRGFRVRELHPDELLGNTYTTAEKLPDNIDSIQQLSSDTEQTPYNTVNRQKLSSDAEEQLPDNTVEMLPDKSTEKLPGNSYSTQELPDNIETSNTEKLPDNSDIANLVSALEKLQQWPNGTAKQILDAADRVEDERKGMFPLLAGLALLIGVLFVVVCVLVHCCRCWRDDADECAQPRRNVTLRELPKPKEVEVRFAVVPPPKAKVEADDDDVEDDHTPQHDNTSSGSCSATAADDQPPHQQQMKDQNNPAVMHNIPLGSCPATTTPGPQPAEGQQRSLVISVQLNPSEQPTPVCTVPVVRMGPTVQLPHNLLTGSRPATGESATRAQTEDQPLADPLPQRYLFSGSCSAIDAKPIRAQTVGDWLSGSGSTTAEGQPRPQTEESRPATVESATRAQTEESRPVTEENETRLQAEGTHADANEPHPDEKKDAENIMTRTTEESLVPKTDLRDKQYNNQGGDVVAGPSSKIPTKTDSPKPALAPSADASSSKMAILEVDVLRKLDQEVHNTTAEEQPEGLEHAADENGKQRSTDAEKHGEGAQRETQREDGEDAQRETQRENGEDAQRETQRENGEDAQRETQRENGEDAQREDGEDAQRETQRENGEDAQRENGEDAQRETRAEEPAEPEMDMSDKQYNNQQEEGAKVAEQPSMIPTSSGKTRQAPKPASAASSVSAYEFPSSSKATNLMRLEFYRNQQAQLQQHNNRHQLDKVDERKAEEENEAECMGEVAQPKVAEDTNVAQPVTEETPKEDAKAEQHNHAEDDW